jgi:hypothetical protein
VQRPANASSVILAALAGRKHRLTDAEDAAATGNQAGCSPCEVKTFEGRLQLGARLRTAWSEFAREKTAK